jgi:hypothetical protein
VIEIFQNEEIIWRSGGKAKHVKDELRFAASPPDVRKGSAFQHMLDLIERLRLESRRRSLLEKIVADGKAEPLRTSGGEVAMIIQFTVAPCPPADFGKKK